MCCPLENVFRLQSKSQSLFWDQVGLVAQLGLSWVSPRSVIFNCFHGDVQHGIGNCINPPSVTPLVEQAVTGLSTVPLLGYDI